MCKAAIIHHDIFHSVVTPQFACWSAGEASIISLKDFVPPWVFCISVNAEEAAVNAINSILLSGYLYKGPIFTSAWFQEKYYITELDNIYSPRLWRRICNGLEAVFTCFLICIYYPTYYFSCTLNNPLFLEQGKTHDSLLSLMSIYLKSSALSKAEMPYFQHSVSPTSSSDSACRGEEISTLYPEHLGNVGAGKWHIIKME